MAEVRGKGLMLAVEFVQPGTTQPDAAATGRVFEECKARGLLVGKGGLYGNVVRMGPPLTLTEDEAREGAGHPRRRDPRRGGRVTRLVQPFRRRQAVGRAPAGAAATCSTRRPARWRPRWSSPRRPTSTPSCPSAAAAARSWRDASLARRTAVLFAFREIVNARRAELAAAITAEHGKVLERRGGRGAARARGRRVRLRDPRPACAAASARTCRPRSTRTASASRSGWWR